MFETLHAAQLSDNFSVTLQSATERDVMFIKNKEVL